MRVKNISKHSYVDKAFNWFCFENRQLRKAVYEVNNNGLSNPLG
jgi:hypothetical protein